MTPLTERLPLRQTSVWGQFAEARPIPHRYGETAGELLQYDETATRWVWADHACAAIDDVTVAGASAGGWAFSPQTDNTGHPIAMVTFAQPQDPSATIVARGRGKLHARTGGLIENPADAVWDILANIAGNAVSESQLGEFRNACARFGLVIAGNIESADSAQTVIRSLCESIGAIFSADARGLCRVWPGGPIDAARAQIDYRHTLSAKAETSDLANDLTIQYAHETGQAKQSMRLIAPDSVRRYGSRPLTLQAPWIASPRVAYDVGVRFLQQRARPQWAITAGGIKAPIRVADVMTIAHPRLPIADGDTLVLGREYDMDDETQSITAAAPVGAVPAVKLLETSAVFVPTQAQTVDVSTQGSERVLTLTDSDGVTPLVGAAVTLDGGITRTTNFAGRVEFPIAAVSAGQHRLDIVAADGRTSSATVTAT